MAAGWRAVGWAAAVTVIAALTACGDMGGIDRAGKAALALDVHGCPKLDGTFRVSMPLEREGSQVGAMDEVFSKPDGTGVPLKQIRAVTIRRTSPGVFELHWLIEESWVLRQLEIIREFEKPRYRRWYHLLTGPERARYIDVYGQAGYDAEMARLGPETAIVREWRPGAGVSCKNGWIELPRGELRPMRLTLGEDGSVIGEFKGLKTVGVTVWCGDGCRDVPIPTGAFTGTIHWPRADELHAWRPQEMAGRSAFQRPIDEIEAEQAERADAQRREDARRYLSAQEIRRRIEALAPDGTEVEMVEVREGKVHIRYTAPAADENVLQGRIAGASGSPYAPQEVVHGVRSSDMSRRFVEFVLTDSPLVLREASREVAAVAAASPSASTTTPTLARLVVAPQTPETAESPAASPRPVPAGMAEPETVRNRIGLLLPTGCAITDLRYDGDRVKLLGRAQSNHNVSDTLRVLDSAGGRPELLYIQAEAGGVRFEISLPASPLTRG